MALTPVLNTAHGIAALATRVHAWLRSDLLRGQFEPGSRLAIEALAARDASADGAARGAEPSPA